MRKKKITSKANPWLRKALLLLWGTFIFCLLLFFGTLGAVSAGWLGELPSFKELENPNSFLATEIYSADNKLLGKYFDKENRSKAEYEEISPYVIEALISTEDERFYAHSGIDPRSLIRVLIKTVFMGRSESGGGSTISQQLAKNLFPRQGIHSKTQLVLRKFKEWVIASRLEKRYTKEEILTMYLNTVEFVNNAFGIKSASKVYFNSTPDSLKIEQAAMLVGMVQNPSLYNPIRHPEQSLKRRNIVLSQLYNHDKITKQALDSLSSLGLGLNYHSVSHHEGSAPYFREYLRLWLQRWVNEHPKPDGTVWNIYRDGLKVYTTLDSRMQNYAEQSVSEHLSALQHDFNKHWSSYSKDPWNWDRWGDHYKPHFLERKMKQSERYRKLKKKDIPSDSISLIFNTKIPMKIFAWRNHTGKEIDTLMSPMDSVRYFNFFLQAGFMAIEPGTGRIQAWVGGINHKYFQLDHVASTRRQVGSTFKPFVYTMALDEIGFSPCFKVPNVPVTFENFKNWTPKNSSKYKDGEMIELRDALAHSVNRVTAALMKRIGPESVINLVHDMGISGEIPAVPSICLGTVDISVLEMAGSYTTYVNKGVHSKPYFITKIEDKHGNVIKRFIPEQNEVFSEQTAYIMLQFLKDVVKMGTGVRLRYKYHLMNEIAGKTGTTQDNTDGWFMGVVPQLVTATWVGGDDPVIAFRSTALGQGANMALPVFALFLKKVYADPSLGIHPDEVFPKPSQPLTIELDCDKYNEQNQNDYQELDNEDDLNF